MAEIFRLTVRVTPDDIDELGHVNNIVYLRWAQEIAIAHWRARARPEWLSDYVWVVARHEVDYRASLNLGDDVEIRTWIDEAGARGALWSRFIAIGKAGAETPSAEIKSDWCILNARTRRPTRPPKDLVSAFL